MHTPVGYAYFICLTFKMVCILWTQSSINVFTLENKSDDKHLNSKLSTGVNFRLYIHTVVLKDSAFHKLIKTILYKVQVSNYDVCQPVFRMKILKIEFTVPFRRCFSFYLKGDQTYHRPDEPDENSKWDFFVYFHSTVWEHVLTIPGV